MPIRTRNLDRSDFKKKFRVCTLKEDRVLQKKKEDFEMLSETAIKEAVYLFQFNLEVIYTYK